MPTAVSPQVAKPGRGRLSHVLRNLAPCAALMLLSVAGCSNSGKSASGQATVRWAFILPTSWDPVTSRTGADIDTISLAYASLTRLDTAGVVQPSLAQSWRYSEDGRAITFALRPGLRFSDGSPLDAEAVKAFFERGKTETDSFLKDQLADIATISADSPTTVTLHLTQSDYQIPYLVAGRTGAISSARAAQQDRAKLGQWPVGAGPFKMIEFVPESHATLVRNPEYWDAANIHIQRLELTTTPDPATLVAGLASGSIDLAGLPARKIDEAKAAGLTVTVAPSLSVSDISINLNRSPFTDPRVVEAFRYAFDRQELVNVLSPGAASITHQPFPKGYFAFNPDLETRWSYDPARARKLLGLAGYPPGDLSIVITANSIPIGLSGSAGAELIQAQLARIGVRSTIRIIPPGSTSWQNEVYLGKKPQLALDGTIGRESPVQNLLAVFGPSGIMNLSGPHASAAFLQALDKVRETPLDNPNYPSVLREAVRIGVEQSPSNYISSTPWIIGSRPSLHHLNITPSQIRWEGVTLQ